MIREIPRQTLRASLTLARLPLTAAEVMLGHQGEEAWPPALAFDRAGAAVKEAAGAVLHDEDLRAEGRLTATKVDEVRRALTLEAVAEARRAEASDQLDERRSEAAERKQEAKEREQERKRTIAADAAAKKRDAEEKARRRHDASEQAKEAATDTVERQARGGRRVALAAEEKALERERAANDERRRAAALAQGVQAQKVTRARKR